MSLLITNLYNIEHSLDELSEIMHYTPCTAEEIFYFVCILQQNLSLKISPKEKNLEILWLDFKLLETLLHPCEA